VIVVGFMTHSGFRASAPAASFSAEKIDERVAQAGVNERRAMRDVSWLA
jgi:hypothetical protein